MSARMVAEETLIPGASIRCWDPTGWAEPMYSVTTVLRMADFLTSSAEGSAPAPSCRLSSVVCMASWCLVRALPAAGMPPTPGGRPVGTPLY